MLSSGLNRRRVLQGVSALGLTSTLSGVAFADQYPSKVIRIIVGFGAGGTTDTVTRLYAEKMTTLLGVPVITVSKPGGQQLIAIHALREAPPDGYTLYAAVGSVIGQNPAVKKDLGYDPLKDFSLLGVAVTNPGVLVANRDLPFHNLDELVAYAKENPGKLVYASSGVGTADDLSMIAFQQITGTKMVGAAYKADSEELLSVVSSVTQLALCTTLSAVNQIRAGKVRAIAVMTPKRLPFLPDVPSVAETPYQDLSRLEPHTFISYVGPVGMPTEIVNKLNATINQISAMPEIVDRVHNTLYSETANLSPAEFRALAENELAKWREFGASIKFDD